MSITRSKSTIIVHCRVVCSAAPVCPPGHSQAHRPRGPLSPTATSADSASGSPACRCRPGPIPGWSSPVGRLCEGQSCIVFILTSEDRPRTRAEIVSVLTKLPESSSVLGKNRQEETLNDILVHVYVVLHIRKAKIYEISQTCIHVWKSKIPQKQN